MQPKRERNATAVFIFASVWSAVSSLRELVGAKGFGRSQSSLMYNVALIDVAMSLQNFRAALFLHES